MFVLYKYITGSEYRIVGRGKYMPQQCWNRVCCGNMDVILSEYFTHSTGSKLFNGFSQGFAEDFITLYNEDHYRLGYITGLRFKQ